MTHMPTPVHPFVQHRASRISAFFRMMSGAFARFKTSRAAKATIRELSHHSDAELADIGLTRSDLAKYAFEDAADQRAAALLRVYR